MPKVFWAGHSHTSIFVQALTTTTTVRGLGSCTGLPSSYTPLQLLSVPKHLATPAQGPVLAAGSSFVSWKGGKSVLAKIHSVGILSANAIYAV